MQAVPGPGYVFAGWNNTAGNGVSAFAEQALALAAGGVDVLWIETISSEEELRAAVEGAARLFGRYPPLNREKAREAGCDGYLAKPVEPRRVVEEVQKHLDRQAAGG